MSGKDELPFDKILDTLKKSTAALRDAQIPFALAGGIASWARGGPPREHDIDFFVRPEDADRSLSALVDAGMSPVKPPEGWLYKAFDGDVMIDLIFEPASGPVTDEELERAEEMEVQATRMRVLAVTDILATKLLALQEHEVDYDSVLEISRALREQVDWDDLRARTEQSPYAKAFFTLVEELGVMPARDADPAVTSVLGLARRLPELELPKVDWAAADVARDDLVPYFRDADCVVHLAWLIQPSHDRELLWRVNATGSERVFRAVADAGVPSLVYASSVGTYAPGPKDRRVDESWPTTGIETSQYSLQKATVERTLDRFEAEHPQVRVVRLRPGLIFKRSSASEQRRLFLGPLVPQRLLRPGLIPFVPDTPGLVFQAVHTDDVADAYRRAVVGDARGAFNVAADDAIGPDELAGLLRARKLPVPRQVLRYAAQATWRLRLQPSSIGWVDMALNVPLLDSGRARTELGWEPCRTGLEALADALAGMSDLAGEPTPPLEPA